MNKKAILSHPRLTYPLPLAVNYSVARYDGNEYKVHLLHKPHALKLEVWHPPALLFEDPQAYQPVRIPQRTCTLDQEPSKSCKRLPKRSISQRVLDIFSRRLCRDLLPSSCRVCLWTRLQDKWSRARADGNNGLSRKHEWLLRRLRFCGSTKSKFREALRWFLSIIIVITDDNNNNNKSLDLTSFNSGVAPSNTRLLTTFSCRHPGCVLLKVTTWFTQMFLVLQMEHEHTTV